MSTPQRCSQDFRKVKASYRICVGLVAGIIAGIIDVIPMFIQKLPNEALLSAFSMWVVVGLMVATSALKINSLLKGMLHAYLILLPHTFIIGAESAESLPIIFLITGILGSLLGYAISRLLLVKARQ